ncbi:HutD/Ves family protein [Cochlodiniinecator piscidefendens]|uniref:HutD/Ves family protein n=1 Tax=Cochlodiniinecator piscidefendens TaxID=2715756 RepID=UPI001409F6B6|nr:HutD family protein [Cochlodiniinecator piscidefendens]
MTCTLLNAQNYKKMLWANGLGTTTEVIKVEDEEGLLWRISMAIVNEEGAFSSLVGIDRTLIVIDGPGFDLIGDECPHLAQPLAAVRFSGDIAISATNLAGPSVDFNVMTARRAFHHQAEVLHGQQEFSLKGDTNLICALGQAVVGNNGQNHSLGPRDALMVDGPEEFVLKNDAQVIAVEIFQTC